MGFYPRARGGRDILTSPYTRPVRRFYPRARGGRDYQDFTVTINELQFLSTRPRGARLKDINCLSLNFGFYPRARGGRDTRQLVALIKGGEVSIHAPAGGATYLPC